jgi:predicted glycosyltransferase
MAKSIRIVNYAVNGSGIGHLVRLSAVNRWIRRYCEFAGVHAEIYFLTSSEADGILFADRFASFKLPSKTVVGESGIDKTAYLALAKQWVWHSLGLLRPDLLVVDTFPRGSFGELLSALDLCRRRAFIYRPVKDSFAARADFQAMLPLYDAILVPDDKDMVAPADVAVPDAARGRVVFTGPVMARERVEMLDRVSARARLGVEDGLLAVYVSAGGGGDPGAERQLMDVIEALGRDSGTHIVVGAGPLYRGRVVYGPRITWLAGDRSSELMAGMDAAVSASGYNTFFELMYAGIPTVFLPQEKVADEQGRRAQRAVEAGAATIQDTVDAASLRAAMERLRDPKVRGRASAAARALVPGNNARRLAAELLRLVLTQAEVAAAEEGVSDGILAASVELGTEIGNLFEIARALASRQADARGGPEPSVPEADAASISGYSVEIARAAAGYGIPMPQAVRIVKVLAHKGGQGGGGMRAQAILGLLRDLAAFGDWAGAENFMKVFGIEHDLPAGEFAAEVGAFLGKLRGRGVDLYKGIACLCAAQDARTGGVPDNRELLRRACAQLCGERP